MEFNSYNIISLILIVIVAFDIKLMSSPKTALIGNRFGAIAMLATIVAVLIQNNIIDTPLLIISILIGGIIGLLIAVKITTIKIPQIIALFNGFGGGASFFVSSIIIFEKNQYLDLSNRYASLLAIIIGAVTLSGSLIAAGKLDNKIPQRPITIKGHNIILLIIITALVLLLIFDFLNRNSTIYIILFFIASLSLLFGILFTIRIGGADMPIAISLLNSYSGLAASICGFAISDALLVSIGAIVGAAGLFLTRIMCKAMNRSLLNVLTGGILVSKINNNLKNNFPQQADQNNQKPLEFYYKILKDAKRIIIVPGFGMALAQAQWQVKKLYNKLLNQGTDVKFAIHPVAGRMPGHMNVLLAEVDIPYERLFDIDAINPEFKEADVVIVVGACDVVNPAANTAQGTPIYGMPILNVHEAKHIIVCNKDTKPGYSGVNNSLYSQENVLLLLGDAGETLNKLLLD